MPKEIGFLIIKEHEIEETFINDAFTASKRFLISLRISKINGTQKSHHFREGTTLLPLADYHIPLARTRPMTFEKLIYGSDRRSFKTL